MTPVRDRCFLVLRQNIGWWAVFSNSAILKPDDAIKTGQQIKVMAGDQHPLRQRRQHVRQAKAGGQIETGERFIHNKNVWLQRHDGDDAQTLSLAIRQFMDACVFPVRAPVLRQSADRLLAAMGGGRAPRTKAEGDFLQHCWKNDLVVRILEHKTNLAHGGCAIKRGVYPVNENPARVRCEKSVRQAQECAFAGAIVTQ